MRSSAGELAVRNGDAAADAGRAQLLALHQRLEDLALLEPGHRGGLLGQRLIACFLLFALSEGTIASGLMRSLRSIFFQSKIVPGGARRHAGARRVAVSVRRSLLALCCDGSIQPMLPSLRR